MPESRDRASAAPPPASALVAQRLVEAIHTLAALPDRERFWLKGLSSAWPAPLRDFWGEFGHAVLQGGAGPPQCRTAAP